jgi:putative FmdB family regulatory protein
MPTYTFECPKCKSQIELIQTVKEHTQHSPLCVKEGCDGQQTMTTVLHTSGFILKGSGWTKRN